MMADQGIALKHLDTLFREGELGGLTDAELLERFTSRRDEAAELAFAALVGRHGPMVLRVCRGVLRDPHDSLDAFQATFLVLVRRAGSLWVRDSLGPWLHQVALRTACWARTTRARRRQSERRAAGLEACQATNDTLDDLGGVIHEEVGRLPERYRAVVVLCLLEGLAPELAARHLGCPVGTVHSRLARGRGRLRSRLARRGIVAPSVVLAASLPRAAPAAIPPALVESTACAADVWRSGMGTGAGPVASAVAELTREVVRSMLLGKLRVAMTVALSIGLVTTGVGFLASVGAMTGGLARKIQSKRGDATDAPRKPSGTPATAKASDGLQGAADRRQPIREFVVLDSDAVMAVAYAPDGRMIASGGMDGTLRLWDMRTGERRATLKVPRGMVRGVAFSTAGETVAGVSDDGMLRLWDATSGDIKRTLPAFSEAMQGIVQSSWAPSVVFSPDGKCIAVGGGGGSILENQAVYQIRTFDAGSGRLMWEHIGRGEWNLSMAFSPDGKSLAHAGSRTARLWDAATGDMKRLLKPLRGGVSAVSFSSDGKLIAGGGARRGDNVDAPSVGQVSIWDAGTGAILRTLEGPTGGARTIAFAPAGHAVACGGYGRVEETRAGTRLLSEVRLWDAASGRLRWTWEGSSADVTSIAFSPDGKTLAVCDKQIFDLVDVACGKTIRTLMKSSYRPR